MIKKSSFTAYSKNSSYGNTVFLLLIVVGLNKRWCLSEKRMFLRRFLVIRHFSVFLHYP